MEKRKRIRKLQIKWRNDATRHLIKCVERKEALWNHSSADYKMRKSRTDLWAQVAAEMSVDFVGLNVDLVEEVKIRWNILRSNFRSNLTKIEKSGQAPNIPHEGITFEFYSDLLFLVQDSTEPKMDFLHQAQTSTPTPSIVCKVEMEYESSQSPTPSDPLFDNQSNTFSTPIEDSGQQTPLPIPRIDTLNRAIEELQHLSNHLGGPNDEWRRLGNFVEGAGRDFSSNPEYAKMFKISVYKLVVEFEERLLESK